jgi:hypothetical protein
MSGIVRSNNTSQSGVVRHGGLQTYNIGATRLASAGAGVQSITGVPFKPKGVFIGCAATTSSQQFSLGYLSESNTPGIISRGDVSDYFFTDAGSIAKLSNGVIVSYVPSAALTADGVDLTWVVVGAGINATLTLFFIG